ncbi:MAG TPA: DUF4293 domain-containing protein [Dysgonamonadaceae bacterium]|jgi:hypothetical protein|uniref:DUF4293 domain-containing protein n=1 Tax=Seramator thermalis TaxID=2496270 RepID=UPI00101DA91E|nr:DUF4293 domain-containing protein [Seramator thermalis]MBP9030661.1 DUF4293 domain-containing protein [Dysgonamonadaceae bacterium]HOM62373.1 DUF4293 domain-containing protein [Dysgonamonadaceae bacterium]HPD43217.1 DUF4293 domain-containing protein [Dysgonamonadaceae bacterium]HQG07177.1 DUF4293 domain-containing protein [Dysgonamonadaceae bacterium]HQI43671.1 DUF4293 domain-containing protein [Dysgonamonadaceae bacterium]
MLQRVQSLYLFLASGCMVLAIILPLITFAFGNQHISFEAMGFYQNGELVASTWGLFAIGAISAALSLLVIFLYNKRIVQIRLTIANIFVMIGFYLYFAFLMFMRNPEANLVFQKIGPGIIMPLISIIFSWLAIRKIGEDEVLIRSLDRLRK